MNHASIFLPILALVSWTLLNLLCVPYQRFRAVRAGTISVDDFKSGESASVPDTARIPNRNYMNLIEAPALFYVVCLIHFLAMKVDATAIALSWTYVVLRIAQSLIHLTYNRVVHRLAVFATSNVVLTVLTIRLVIALA